MKNIYKCCLNPSDTLAVYILYCAPFRYRVTASFSFGSLGIQTLLVAIYTILYFHQQHRRPRWEYFESSSGWFGRKINLWISSKINRRRPAVYDIVLGRYLSNNKLFVIFNNATRSEKKGFFSAAARVLLPCTVYWFRVIGRNRLVFVCTKNARVRERATAPHRGPTTCPHIIVIIIKIYRHII